MVTCREILRTTSLNKSAPLIQAAALAYDQVNAHTAMRVNGSNLQGVLGSRWKAEICDVGFAVLISEGDPFFVCRYIILSFV